MRIRTLAFSLAPLFLAPLAHAQAPGEVAPVVVQPVVVAPVVVAPVVAPADVACTRREDGRESVMANRWSVGFSVGGMSLAPKDSPDDHTGFTIAELALRYRLTRHFELEASAGGGRERTADDMDGDLAVTAFGLSARYRFMPEAAWNLFAMGGIGGASVTRHDATDQERDDALQPFGMLGVGIERRFHHVALQAELRAIGMGKSHDDQRDPPVAEARAMPVTTTTSSPDIERSGASFSVGLSYYF
jgi:hypothetical protein